MSRRRRFAVLTAGLTLVAVPAFAAADQSFDLTPQKPTVSWEGPPQTTRGAPLYDYDARTTIPCDTPARPCDDVVLNVTAAGKLTVKVEGVSDASGTSDPDLYLYKSDKDGTQGEELATSAASGPDTVTEKVTPGYYLARADYYHATNAGYKGEAKLSGFASPAPAPAPAPAPPPAPTPAPQTASGTPKPTSAQKRAACKKKAKKIKNAKKRKRALKRCARK